MTRSYEDILCQSFKTDPSQKRIKPLGIKTLLMDILAGEGEGASELVRQQTYTEIIEGSSDRQGLHDPKVRNSSKAGREICMISSTLLVRKKISFSEGRRKVSRTDCGGANESNGSALTIMPGSQRNRGLRAKGNHNRLSGQRGRVCKSERTKYTRRPPQARSRVASHNIARRSKRS